MARTIQSPGVEIKEVDLSLRPELPAGTTVLIPGFAHQGPTDEIIQISSISEFEQIYGAPSNAAERYLYHTTKATLGSPANVNVVRLSYGAGNGSDVTDQYSALIYPVVPIITNAATLSGVTDVSAVTPAAASYINSESIALSQLDDDDYTSVIYNTDRAALSGVTDLSSITATASAYLTNSSIDITTLEASDHKSILDHTLKTDLESITDLTSVTTDALSYITDASVDLSSLESEDWTSILENNTTGKIEYKDADIYFVGEPSSITVTSEKYRKLIQNNLDWSGAVDIEALSATATGGFEDSDNLNGAGIVVLNKKRVAINEKFEGSYVGLIDNASINAGSDFDSIQKVKSLTDKHNGIKRSYKNVPDIRFTFDVSAPNNGAEGSVSEVMENLSEFNLATDEFSDVLSIGVFKIRGSTLDPDTTKLDYVLQESFTGSLNYYSKQFPVEGGNPVSFFIEGESQASSTVKVYVNPFLSKEGGDWIDAGQENAVPKKKVRLLPSDTNTVPTEGNVFLNDAEDSTLLPIAKAIKGAYIESPQNLYPTGAFKQTIALGDSVTVGDIPGKLRRVFDWADNYELYDFDIITEAGLGTVHSASRDNTLAYFDDEKYVNGVNALQKTKEINSEAIVEDYRAVVNELNDFCTTRRKDCIFIADGLRHSLVQGEDSKILDDESKTFSKDVYWPMRHVFQSFNTSYGVAYANWAKTYDTTLNKNIWVPFSGFGAAAMANTDSNFQPWFAPAGFTRGIVSGAVDLAVYPKQKHRDALYKVSLNPVANFPNDGFVIFGQKTLQTKPSAFDRINVRRMFLYAEKAVRSVMKYFVFEPNTLRTRTQVLNVLTPIFDRIKNTDGLYDYLLICDERNNTPAVIDQNELVVDIYIKPVRTAEFILVNFYATRTDQSFREIVT